MLFLLLAILLAPVLPVEAQIVDFRATAGYEGRARIGQYAPLSMTLQAGQATKGSVRIFEDGDEICRIPYSLRDGEVRFINKNLHLSRGSLYLHCYDENDSLVASRSQHQIIFQQFYRNEVHLLDVSRNPFQIPGLSTLQFRPGRNAQQQNRPDIVTSHLHGDFPRHSKMLESVDAIVPRRRAKFQLGRPRATRGRGRGWRHPGA